MTEQQLEEIATRGKEAINFTLTDEGAMEFTKAVIAALPASEQKPRFECWSTNEGDSWYEHPADAELLYDVLGDNPKVGDEFEVMAGWCSVQARYRIVLQNDDDFEVECISHPIDNSPDSAARIKELEAEVERFKQLWDAAEDHVHALREKLRVAREAKTPLDEIESILGYIPMLDKARQALATIGEE